MGRKDFDGWEQALESRLTGRFPWGSIALETRRFVFSFEPRCQGLCGSQK